MVSARRVFPHSLGVRLFALVVISVGVVLAVHAFFNYRSTRDDLLGFLRRNAEQSSGLIARATHDGMLLNRLDDVQDTIERLAHGDGVAAIRVYDKHGAVVLSAAPEEIGRTVGLGSEICSSCHATEQARADAVLETSGLASDTEEQVLRHLRVIPNEAGCARVGCHASPTELPILGVLDVEMSMAPVRATLRAEQSRMVWTTLALIFVLGLSSAIYIHRVIHRPVLQLQAGTERIAAGELQTRIDVRGSHELGALAHAFNQMAADLGQAQEELTRWSHRLEEKVVAKTEELQRAQVQVLHMEKMASLGKLSATVAHELNNPISAMLNYTRLVERELTEPELSEETRDEVKRYLRLLREECLRCGRIVTNLLLFAKPHGAPMGDVDLNDVVERSLMLVQHHLHMCGGELRVERLEGDAHLVADTEQLQQALVALLVNAIEAMACSGESGGVLTVRLEGQPDSVGIHIRDTGVGIPPDALPRIYEPFFSTKDAQSGVGLGLAVVYGIVRRHGGTIEAESEPGRGTAFHIILPRRPRPSVAELETGVQHVT